MFEDESKEHLFAITPLAKGRQAAQKKQPESFVPRVQDANTSFIEDSFTLGYGSKRKNPKSNEQRILSWRRAAANLYASKAIDQIVYEAIPHNYNQDELRLDLDSTELPDNIKNEIHDSFTKSLKMLSFKNNGATYFRNFYIDSKTCMVMIPHTQRKEGLKEVRYIDPVQLTRHPYVKKIRDKKTNTEVIKSQGIYYKFKPTSLNTTLASLSGAKEYKIDESSIIYVTSGLLDPTRTYTVSHMDKALKPITNLRDIEDAQVIYRAARASEKRAFYIDVGNLQEKAAERKVRQLADNFKFQQSYDLETGEIHSDKDEVSMLHDYWIPRTGGNKGTEIDIIGGNNSLSDTDTLEYFQQKVKESLDVPLQRLTADNPFSSGRSTEISRDEANFQKFINGLRRRFSQIFFEIVKTDLVLKNIISLSDWRDLKEDIEVIWPSNNHFFELLETEIWKERLDLLGDIETYTEGGTYFSKNWVYKNILKMTDEQIKEMQSDIENQPTTEDDF